MPLQLVRKEIESVRADMKFVPSETEEKALRETLRTGFQKALEHRCRRIAFSLPEEGKESDSEEKILKVMMSEFQELLSAHEMKVLLAIPQSREIPLPKKIIREIDEKLLEEKQKEFYEGTLRVEGLFSMTFPDFSEELLSERLKKKEDSFQKKLFSLIDEKGLDEVEVYKKANLNRKVFSKIRSCEDYRPKKTTVAALGVALRLSEDEMEDLFERAGYSFSPSSTFDLILSYFLQKKNYDLYEINAALFYYHQPLIGSRCS